MSRIPATFKRLRWEKEAALVPHVIVGYPSLDITRQLVPIMARQGADLIVLGVPGSDPAADGTTLQRASRAALRNGVSLADCLSIAEDSRRANEVPLALRICYSSLYKYGLETLVGDCAAAGADGLIVPDLAPEEAGDLKSACSAVGIDLIFLLAPIATDERIRRVAETASGFILCVSPNGAVAEGSSLGQEYSDLVASVRGHTNLPLVVGSDISTLEEVAEVTRLAEGVAVGASIINLIDSLPEGEVLYSVGEFIREMKGAMAGEAAK